MVFHRARGAPVPQQVRDLLSRSAAREAAVAMKNQRCQRQLCQSLEAAGLTAILLKGSRSAFDLYDQPTQRVSGDIDLLIPREQIERYAQLMRDLGYQPTWPSMEWQLANHYHAGFLAKEALVELHWHLNGQATVPIKGLWSRSQPFTSELIRGLGPEDRLLYLLHHAVGHGMNANLYQYLDIALLLHKTGRSLDSHRLEKLLPAWGRPRGYALALSVVKILFPSAPIDHALALLPKQGIPAPVLAGALRCALAESKTVEIDKRVYQRASRPRLAVPEETLRARYGLAEHQPVTLNHQVRYLAVRADGWMRNRLASLRDKGFRSRIDQFHAVDAWLAREAGGRPF